MSSRSPILLASLIVIATGALWGLYWLPVRQLAGHGMTGAWGTLLAALMAVVLLAPAAWHRRDQLIAASPLALASTALGGASFMLYSVGLVYGRVAIIILLFYLTPVWSTLIGRYILGWPSTPGRIAAIGVGLVGLAVMLGADGQVPLPQGTGEWLALVSGVLWSVSSTGIRTSSTLGPAAASFCFSAGAAVGALALAPVLEPVPHPAGFAGLVAWTLSAGGLWWAASMAALMWATARLEPARVGILLMSEVLVGAVTGALFAGEHLGPVELVGGALVLAAAIIEIASMRRAPPDAA